MTNEEVSSNYSGAPWQIVPNPVNDMLNLFYRRNDFLKGVINIIIQDAAGKVVMHFRAASTNEQLHIPVSKLHTGVYFIRINVGADVQLNDKFVKQ
jgi:Secretion system C-terminal sorting domain